MAVFLSASLFYLWRPSSGWEGFTPPNTHHHLTSILITFSMKNTVIGMMTSKWQGERFVNRLRQSCT